MPESGRRGSSTPDLPRSSIPAATSAYLVRHDFRLPKNVGKAEPYSLYPRSSSSALAKASIRFGGPSKSFENNALVVPELGIVGI